MRGRLDSLIFKAASRARDCTSQHLQSRSTIGEHAPLSPPAYWESPRKPFDAIQSSR